MAALLYASRQPDAAYEIVLVASNDPAAGGLRPAVCGLRAQAPLPSNSSP